MLSKKHLKMLVFGNSAEAEKNKMYWSRKPGNFVNKLTGKVVETGDYSFTGTVREWYETLTETCIDVGNYYGLGENFSAIVSPDVLTIFECGVLYKPIFEQALFYRKRSTETTETFELLPFQELEAYNTKKGRMYNHFDVYLEPDLPRNQVLCFSDDLKKFAMVEIVDMDII